MCNVINFRSSASLIGSPRSCTDMFLRFLVLEAIVFHVYKACVFTQNARQVSSLLEIMSLLFTRITMGNPVVFQGYLYPYPSKPTPTVEGMGFAGQGKGFCGSYGSLQVTIPFMGAI